MTTKGKAPDSTTSATTLSEDDIDAFFAAFIEMVLGPEHKDKNIDELTEEQKAQVVKAISQISGEFTG